jgi:hypothetical protein
MIDLAQTLTRRRTPHQWFTIANMALGGSATALVIAAPHDLAALAVTAIMTFVLGVLLDLIISADLIARGLTLIRRLRQTA